MPTNLPGPYSVEYQYNISINSQTITHSLELSCAVIGAPAVGTVPGAISLQTRSGASLPLLTGVNDVWQIVRTGLNSVASCVGWTLWRYVPGTLAKDFITAGTVTNPLGTQSGTPTAAAQTKLTFRTAAGGILQTNLLEGAFSGNTKATLIPAGTGAWQVIYAAYLLSASGWVLGRDDSYPVAALNVSLSQNEALFKARFR